VLKKQQRTGAFYISRMVTISTRSRKHDSHSNTEPTLTSIPRAVMGKIGVRCFEGIICTEIQTFSILSSLPSLWAHKKGNMMPAITMKYTRSYQIAYPWIDQLELVSFLRAHRFLCLCCFCTLFLFILHFRCKQLILFTISYLTNNFESVNLFRTPAIRCSVFYYFFIIIYLNCKWVSTGGSGTTIGQHTKNTHHTK
jgi:hypothetical protein